MTELHTLPRPLTRFIGRRVELAELQRVVALDRLVTLTGAGGVGKTRLAAELARQLVDEFPGAAWYVDLAPITDPLIVPSTVAHTMGLPDQPGRSAAETILGFVGNRRALLLLDNCEHLLDGCGRLVADLLDGAAQLTILATSREPIGVDGELTWTVPPMSVADEAIELFSDRARHARLDFRCTDDDLGTVADICARLDGMPLAIELAAARVRSLSLTHILDNLDDRFRLLTGGARTALLRHQTLRASVDWSYALLPEPQRQLFCRLSVFRGGFDLEAAQAVGVGGVNEQHMVIGCLGGLIDKSMVIAESAGSAMRYRLLETMRQYALEKLAETGDTDVVRTLHRDHYLGCAEGLGPRSQEDHQHLVEWADTELDNLRVAYRTSSETGAADEALRLACSLQHYWLLRGRLLEGMAWIHEILTTTTESDITPEVWVRAVVNENTLAGWLPAPANLEQVQAALSVARQLGDPTLIASTLNACGELSVYEPNRARAYLEEAAAVSRAGDDRRTLCETRLYQAVGSNSLRGDPMLARAYAEECYVLADGLGDRLTTLHSRIWLGCALHSLGSLNEAVRILLPLIEEGTAAGQPFIVFFANVFLGRVLAHRGEPARARECGQTSVEMADAMGGMQGDAAYALMGEVALAEGDGPAAKAACETSWRHVGPLRRTFLRILNPMPEALLACGELTAARQCADDTVEVVEGCHKSFALTVRSLIAAAQCEHEQAARDAHDALDGASEHTCVSAAP